MIESDSRKIITLSNLTLLIAFVLFLSCVFVTLYITKAFGPFTALTTLTLSTILQEAFALILPVILFVKKQHFEFAGFLRLKPAKLGITVRILFLAASGYLFITCFIVLWNLAFGTHFLFTKTIQDYIPNDFFGVMGIILNVAFISAIAEEFLFRGVLLRGLEPLGKFWAIVLSAFAFAVFHISFYKLGYAFVLGIFIGYLAAITDNILYAIIYHCLHNIFSSFIDISYLISNAVSSLDKSTILFVYLIGLIIASLFMVTIFISIKEAIKKQRENEYIRKEELEEKLKSINELKNTSNDLIDEERKEQQTEKSQEIEEPLETQTQSEMKSYELTELLYLRDIFDNKEYLRLPKVKFYLKDMFFYIAYSVLATCIIIFGIMP